MELSVQDLDALTSWTVIRAAHRLEHQLTEMFTTHGLSPVQFGVLAHLATGRSLTRAQLAREVLVRPQSIAGVLDGLVARGLVALDGRGGRGRPNPATLTPAGHLLLDELWPLVQAANDPLHLRLSSAEAEQVNHLLLRITTPPPPAGAAGDRRPTRDEENPMTTTSSTSTPTSTDPAAAQHALTEHLHLITSGRIEEWVRLFATDGVLEFPYAPPGVPARVQGHSALMAHMSSFPDTFDVEVADLRFHPTQDAGTAVAEFRLTGTAVATGKPYEQTCISVVHTDARGLITRYVDYWNPLAAVEALTPSGVDRHGVEW